VVTDEGRYTLYYLPRPFERGPMIRSIRFVSNRYLKDRRKVFQTYSTRLAWRPPIAVVGRTEILQNSVNNTTFAGIYAPITTAIIIPLLSPAGKRVWCSWDPLNARKITTEQANHAFLCLLICDCANGSLDWLVYTTPGETASGCHDVSINSGSPIQIQRC